MHRSKLFLFFGGALLLAAQADVTLQRAIRKESLEGDLKGAIALYQKALAEAKSDRATAAQALIRMAECHQKLGDSESRKIYERVLREYADQKDAAALARTRLGAPKSESKGDRPVWSGPGVDMFGRISPDGTLLTYNDWSTGNLWLRNLAAGTSHQLTHVPDYNEMVQYSIFSNDGKQIAYEWWTSKRDKMELRVATLQGTALTNHRTLVLNDDIRNIRPYDWSGDGKWILVHVIRMDRASQIGIVNAQSGDLRIIQSTDWAGPTNAVFSADSRYIIFDSETSDNDPKRDIHIRAIDGSQGSTAVAHPADDRVIGLSPDGKTLLFASDRSGSFGIWALPYANGKTHGAATNVRTYTGFPWPQGISRSGTLYVTKGSSDQDMYIAPFDAVKGVAGTPVPLQAYPNRGRPEWSPDGKQLAFIDCGDFGGGPCKILVYSMETKRTRRVPHALGYLDRPSWSPDGRTFLTRGTDRKGRRAVHTIDVATGETKFLFEDGMWPEYFADGKRILFRRKDVLFVREADGTERELLKHPAAEDYFRFSPDRSQIAFVTKNVLYVMPASGGELREVLRIQAPETFERAFSLHWFPDGQSLLVSKFVRGDQGRSKQDLWQVTLNGQSRKLDIDSTQWSQGGRLSPDGRHIAYLAGKRSIEIWAIENLLPR